MAYLFSRLNETIDGAANPRSSDMLGQPASGAQPPQADRETLGAMASQPSAIIGGAPAAQPNAPGVAPTAVNSEARSKVFDKNKNAELVADTDKFSSAIAQTQADQQTEANKFVAGQKYGQVADDTISKAVRQNDETARTAVSSLLYGAAPEAQKYTYDDRSLGSYRDQVKDLNTTGGRTALLQSRGGMSSGEAKFDAALLGKSKAFGAQRDGIIGKFTDVQNDIGTQKARTDSALETVAREREADKLRVRSALEGIKTGTIAEATKRRETAAKENEGLLSSQKATAKAEADNIVAEYRKKIEDQRAIGGVLPYKFDSLVDKLNARSNSGYLDFVDSKNPELDDSMFLADQDVSTLNNANDLLGQGTRYTKGTLGTASAKLNAERVRAELDALLNPGLSSITAESAANRLADQKRVDAQRTIAAAEKGNTNDITASVTGGNEGVTGGGTTVPKGYPVSTKPSENIKTVVGRAKEVAKESLRNTVDPIAATKASVNATKKVFKKLFR